MTTAAQSQIVVGLQGGYINNRATNSINADFVLNTSYLGGLRVGYMVTPKLMVAIAANYHGNASTNYIAADSVYREGMMHGITNHQYDTTRGGWSVTPQIRYQVLRYGNMKFNIMLQGTYGKLGRTTSKEIYTSWQNNGLTIDEGEKIGDNTLTNIDVRLYPTLVYEFSEHLAAELSLDLLSIGYRKTTTTFDAVEGATPATSQPERSIFNTGIYGGVNTMSDPLQWQECLLRLGFYYTF